MNWPRGAVRPALGVLPLCLLWALTRYVDDLALVFLRQQTGMSFPSAVARNFRLDECLFKVAIWVPLGIALWLGVAAVISRRARASWFEAMPFADAARVLFSLWVPLGLTALAWGALVVSPVFPYGLSLALTLAYEGAFRDLLTVGLLWMSFVHAIQRLSEPEDELHPEERPSIWRRRVARVAVVLAATGAFAALTPRWLWKEGEGQGNSLKYLRMAATLAGSGTLDIARAEEGREATVSGFLGRFPEMSAGWSREGARLLAAVRDAAREGKIYIGENRAETANRAMFRSPSGGVYYINAPGPGILLVPAYLMDRVLNRRRGGDRQVAVLLFWNLLGALLLVEMMLAARELVPSDAAAESAALFLCAAPPILLYTHHIYPELPAALGLLVVFRRLFMDAAPSFLRVLAASLALGFLPWLHQKYSVTVAIMAVAAFMRIAKMNALARVPRLLVLAVTLSFSAFAILVYNHALTGSVLPDATFRAAGRVAFQPETIPTGSLGLFFDVENGLFIYAPLYLLALAGFRTFSSHSPNNWFYWIVFVTTFVLVIASFPYWAGAVSAVGRYMLSVAPLAVLPIALVLWRAPRDGLVSGIAVTLAAASLAFSFSFYADEVPAYETHLLLTRTLYSDPYQYLPSFLNDPDPAHAWKLGAVLLVAGIAVYAMANRLGRDLPRVDSDAWRRVPEGATLVLGLVLGAALLLERVPGNESKKTGPVYRDSVRAGDFDVAATGDYVIEEGRLFVPAGGESRLLVFLPESFSTLRVALEGGAGETLVRLDGQREIVLTLTPGEHRDAAVPLARAYAFEGPNGKAFVYSLEVRATASDTSGPGVFLTFVSS